MFLDFLKWIHTMGLECVKDFVALTPLFESDFRPPFRTPQNHRWVVAPGDGVPPRSARILARILAIILARILAIGKWLRKGGARGGRVDWRLGEADDGWGPVWAALNGPC